MSGLKLTIDGIAVALTGFFVSTIVVTPIKNAFYSAFCELGAGICVYSFLLLFVVPLIGTIYTIIQIIPYILEFISGATQSGGGML
jgi:hypothetical protein